MKSIATVIANVAAALILFSASTVVAAQKVHLLVHVPADTPANDTVFLAGSLPSFGEWKADGLPLRRQTDGIYVADIEIDSAQSIEFKVTRGSWETVEKNADGSERTNRRVDITDAINQIDITVERWANAKPATTQASTVVGRLELHQIHASHLGQPRTIRVWLPPVYDADASAHFGVLYMQDGQNCFDRATSAYGHEWEIDETCTALIADQKIQPLIVVGIDNNPITRINEFTFDSDAGHPGGGGGALYADFLINEVKPFVDRAYRTKPDVDHTLIGGSSLGAMLSLETARRHPKVFSGVIAMSPSLWWADQTLTKQMESDAGGLVNTKIWLDIGSREDAPLAPAGDTDSENAKTVAQACRFDAALTRLKISHRFTIDHQHAEHNEMSWASRFPQALTYLMESSRDAGQP